MDRPVTVGYLDVILALSDALDLVSPIIVGHHKRVACIALALAKELDLPEEDRSCLVLSASVHDCGAFTLKNRIDSLDFEMVNPHEHADQGYHLLRTFSPMEEIASVIRFHHLPWSYGQGQTFGDLSVPTNSHILNLADRIAVLIEDPSSVLEQKDGIAARINEGAGAVFAPDHIEAFNTLSEMEYFWFDAVSPEITSILVNQTNLGSLNLTAEEFKGLITLFYRIIDFRSSFTATHTGGVQACAEALARLCGFSSEDCERISIAACLHDLGKLSVPAEILEKKGPLTHREQIVVRGHPYYGYRLLERFSTIQDINGWASFHHECLDGHGYPFHLSAPAISEGSRIMSVADVFTAITEHRPYRTGMDSREALGVMQSMAKYGKLDADLVELVNREHELLDGLRAEAQSAARSRYDSFRRSCGGLECAV